ncbi:hypothetical protein LCGC14_1437390 [marine sediment metagenome]|uniref:Uncharacterized protein n=1 Tax=marine sediment metagenome TaxID=412755 RepID=A0A0F9MNP8_9ZZZZ
MLEKSVTLKPLKKGLRLGKWLVIEVSPPIFKNKLVIKGAYGLIDYIFPFFAKTFLNADEIVIIAKYEEEKDEQKTKRIKKNA